MSKEPRIIKFAEVCGVPLGEEDVNLAELKFIFCAPNEVDAHLSYISRCSKVSLAVVMNDRSSGQIQQTIEGKDVDEIVFVSALIVGPAALKELELVAIDSDDNIESTLMRVLEAGLKVLSGRPVA